MLLSLPRQSLPFLIILCTLQSLPTYGTKTHQPQSSLSLAAATMVISTALNNIPPWRDNRENSVEPSNLGFASSESERIDILNLLDIIIEEFYTLEEEAYSNNNAHNNFLYFERNKSGSTNPQRSHTPTLPSALFEQLKERLQSDPLTKQDLNTIVSRLLAQLWSIHDNDLSTQRISTLLDALLQREIPPFDVLIDHLGWSLINNPSTSAKKESLWLYFETLLNSPLIKKDPDALKTLYSFTYLLKSIHLIENYPSLFQGIYEKTGNCILDSLNDRTYLAQHPDSAHFITQHWLRKLKPSDPLFERAQRILKFAQVFLKILKDPELQDLLPYLTPQ